MPTNKKNRAISMHGAKQSRLSDLNQLPARYECAALPGELSRRMYKFWGRIKGRRLELLRGYQQYASYR